MDPDDENSEFNEAVEELEEKSLGSGAWMDGWPDAASRAGSLALVVWCVLMIDTTTCTRTNHPLVPPLPPEG